MILAELTLGYGIIWLWNFSDVGLSLSINVNT